MFDGYIKVVMPCHMSMIYNLIITYSEKDISCIVNLLWYISSQNHTVFYDSGLSFHLFYCIWCKCNHFYRTSII